MTIQKINYGLAPDDGNGDPLRVAFKKSDDNFADLDSRKAEQQDVATALAGKVDKETGKGLSTNDFTTAEKNKLADIAEQATKNATDAALRDRSTHTGTQPASTITGLGTAATRNVGTSTDEVLTVGAGGWLIQAHANSYMSGYPTTRAESISQIYRREDTDGGVDSYAASVHFAASDTWGRLRIAPYNKTAWVEGGSLLEGWSSQLLLMDNVTLPIASGGIIESGSNANGTYTKFVDGTLICQHSRPVVYSSPTILLADWAYPAIFVGSPTVAVSLNTITGDSPAITKPFVIQRTELSNTSVRGLLLTTLSTAFVTSDADNQELQFIAVGRWK